MVMLVAFVRRFRRIKDHARRMDARDVCGAPIFSRKALMSSARRRSKVVWRRHAWSNQTSRSAAVASFCPSPSALCVRHRSSKVRSASVACMAAADTFGVAKGDVFALHAAGAPRTVGGARGASAKAFALSMIFSMVVPPTRTGCRCLVCGSASGSVSRSRVCHSTLSRVSTPGRSLL